MSSVSFKDIPHKENDNFATFEPSEVQDMDADIKNLLRDYHTDYSCTATSMGAHHLNRGDLDTDFDGMTDARTDGESTIVRMSDTDDTDDELIKHVPLYNPGTAPQSELYSDEAEGHPSPGAHSSDSSGADLSVTFNNAANDPTQQKTVVQAAQLGIKMEVEGEEVGEVGQSTEDEVNTTDPIDGGTIARCTGVSPMPNPVVEASADNKTHMRYFEVAGVKIDCTKLYTNGKFEARPSKFGRGMFATADIQEGELVCLDAREDGDPTFTRKEIESIKDEKIRSQLQNFAFMVGENEYASTYNPDDDITYFMNHSCDANLWMGETLEGRGYAAFGWWARRLIPKGAELTYDYSTTETDASFHADIQCACGSPACRTDIVRGYRDPEWVEKYEGRLAPHVERAAAAWAKQEGK